MNGRTDKKEWTDGKNMTSNDPFYVSVWDLKMAPKKCIFDTRLKNNSCNFI